MYCLKICQVNNKAKLLYYLENELPGTTVTFMLAQEVDALLEDGRLVHLPGVTRQHGAQFFDEHIELVSPLLFRLVSRNSINVKKKQMVGKFPVTIIKLTKE